MKHFNLRTSWTALVLMIFFSIPTYAQIKFEFGDGEGGSSAGILIGAILIGILIGIGIGYFLFGRK